MECVYCEVRAQYYIKFYLKFFFKGVRKMNTNSLTRINNVVWARGIITDGNNHQKYLRKYLSNVLQFKWAPVRTHRLLLVDCQYVLKLITAKLYCKYWIFSFYHANWHFSATLTEVFPWFFLSCKAIARV